MLGLDENESDSHPLAHSVFMKCFFPISRSFFQEDEEFTVSDGKEDCWD